MAAIPASASVSDAKAARNHTGRVRNFQGDVSFEKPIRALTIRGIDMARATCPVQADMFHEHQNRERRREPDDAIDEIRRRWGYTAICPASLMGNALLVTDKCEIVPMPGLMYQ